MPVPSLIDDKPPLPREGLMTNRKIADIVKDKKFRRRIGEAGYAI